MSQEMTPARPALTSRLKVSTRLSLGFAVVLLLLGAQAGIGWFGLNDAHHAFTRFAGITDDSLTASDVNATVRELRRNVLLFQTGGSEQAAGQARALAADGQRLLGDLAEGLEDTAQKDEVRTLQRHLTAYVDGFERMVVLETETNRAVEAVLDVQGIEATRSLQDAATRLKSAREFEAAAYTLSALESLMSVRTVAMRFLADGDETRLARVQTEMEQFEQDVAEAGRLTVDRAVGDLLTQAARSKKAYVEALDGVAGRVREQTALVHGTMAAEARAIDEGTEKLVEHQVAYKKRLFEATEEGVAATELSTAGVAAAAILIGILAAWLIGRSITGPLSGIMGAMGRIAGGDYASDVPGRERGDELGRMAVALLQFRDGLAEAERLRQEAVLAEQRAEAERQAAMQRMADEFEAAVGEVVRGVASAASEMQATARAMSDTAEGTASRAGTVAAAAGQAAASVQTVASAGEELSASIQEISRQVSTSSSKSSEAVERARQTDTLVQGLSDTAQRIGAVVQLISDIASQTNLLALNATIEAARAGEAGKGFAVVASEVKNLATQTAKATEEIAEQVGAIQSVSGQSVEAIQAIGRTIADLNDIATAIAGAVEEQGAATQDISRSVQEAARGTEEVSASVAGLTEGASSTGSAATQMLGASEDLARQAEALSGAVDGFLARVRAA